LNEPEIAELYGRRSAVVTSQHTYVPLLQGITGADYITRGGVQPGIGHLQLTVVPLGDTGPVEYRLDRRLTQAVEAAGRAIVPERIAPNWMPSELNMTRWRPREAIGWYCEADDAE
jgi:hypothetical protein